MYLDMGQADFGVFLRPSKPISQKTISALENGRRHPSQKTLSLLLKRAEEAQFKLEISDLIDD